MANSIVFKQCTCVINHRLFNTFKLLLLLFIIIIIIIVIISESNNRRGVVRQHRLICDPSQFSHARGITFRQSPAEHSCYVHERFSVMPLFIPYIHIIV